MDRTEERQLEVLQKVYDTWMPSIPALKNRRCSIPDGMIAYISCPDVHDYKYNVRIVPVAHFLDSDEKFLCRKKINIEFCEKYKNIVYIRKQMFLLTASLEEMCSIAMPGGVDRCIVCNHYFINN